MTLRVDQSSQIGSAEYVAARADSDKNRGTDQHAGRDCASTRGQATKPTKREESGDAGGAGTGSQTVCFPILYPWRHHATNTRLHSLEEEKAAWEALASSTSPSEGPPPAPSIPATPPAFSSLDTTLLSPSQAAILDALQLPTTTNPQPSMLTTTTTPTSTPTSTIHPPTSSFTFTSPTALTSHLATLAASLEPTIDLFAHGVHSIEQYRRTAERVADAVLGSASRTLEERERHVKGRVGAEGIGVGDVLRGLAGVLGE